MLQVTARTALALFGAGSPIWSPPCTPLLDSAARARYSGPATPAH